MQSLRIIFAGVLLLIATSAAAVYKWTDAQGNVHYTQLPPSSTDSKSLEIDSAAVDTDVAALKLKTRIAADKAQAQQQKEAADKAAISAENNRIRKDNCRLATQNRDKFNNLAHARVKGEDGEYTYLDDGQRQQKTSEMLDAVKLYCSPLPKPAAAPETAPDLTDNKQAIAPATSAMPQ